MTERPTASSITDAQLDALHERAELAEARAAQLGRQLTTMTDVAKGNKRHARILGALAEQAEDARDRVRALHQPTDGMGYDSDDHPGRYGDMTRVCTACGTSDEYAVRWPCPTIEAIDGIIHAPAATEPEPPADRQPAYDAVFAYIRTLPRDFLPATIVDRNAMIWQAVNIALGAPAATEATEDALRYVQVVISGTDEFTTNRSALCIADHLRAEFADSIAMDITTDAREMTDDPPAPCGHRSPVTGLTPEPSTCIRPSGHEGWHRDDVDRQWASAATEATETGSCGTGHARYPDLHCTEPTSHTGPHAAPYRGGGAAWDGRDVAAIRNLLDERGQISPSHPRPFAKQAPVDASGPVPMPVEPPADR